MFTSVMQRAAALAAVATSSGGADLG